MVELSRAGINRLCLWMYATPVLAFWAIVSFIPLFGLLQPEASVWAKIVDAAFLASGFGGVITLFVAAVLSAKPDMQSAVLRAGKGRVGLLAAYATVWLVAYWLLKAYVV
ncbi:MAG: hypothetical protein AAFR33_09445 [Pseudomonadota bacterium]